MNNFYKYIRERSSMGGCNVQNKELKCEKYLDCDVCLEDKIAEHENEIYNKAIDDFSRHIHKLHNDFSKDGDFSTLYYWLGRIDSVGEQLKRGAENEKGI